LNYKKGSKQKFIWRIFLEKQLQIRSWILRANLRSFDKPLIFTSYLYTNYKHMIAYKGLSESSSNNFFNNILICRNGFGTKEIRNY